MKRQYLVSFFLYGLVIVSLQVGCAGRFFDTVVVADNESETVATAFYQLRQLHRECNCCLDAEVKVTISMPWRLTGRSTTLSGYLQAMSPSFLKFVGINPLGQPFLVLVTDGQRFRSAFVSEAKVYEGKVHSNAFLKYLPYGFSPGSIYYWLTGRVQPNHIKVLTVRRDKKGAGYWLQLTIDQEIDTEWVLFDPDEKTVLRHILLDRDGKLALDVQYEDYPAKAGDCMLPGKITISSPEQNGRIAVVLRDVLADVVFSEHDFDYVLPKGFQKIMVE